MSASGVSCTVDSVCLAGLRRRSASAPMVVLRQRRTSAFYSTSAACGSTHLIRMPPRRRMRAVSSELSRINLAASQASTADVYPRSHRIAELATVERGQNYQ